MSLLHVKFYKVLLFIFLAQLLVLFLNGLANRMILLLELLLFLAKTQFCLLQLSTESFAVVRLSDWFGVLRVGEIRSRGFELLFVVRIHERLSGLEMILMKHLNNKIILSNLINAKYKKVFGTNQIGVTRNRHSSGLRGNPITTTRRFNLS